MIFVVSIFLNSFLLFLLEPMFAKMVLPRMGGTAAVWTTCMLFFQVALVAGYSYAHLVGRLANRTAQFIGHGAVALVVCFFLPIAIPKTWVPAHGTRPEYALLAMLATNIGLPFLFLAAGSPAIQHWAASRHTDKGKAYSLYAASNAGSFVALLAYPVLIEPQFALREQSVLWTVGFGLLLCLLALCAVAVIRSPIPVVGDAASDSAPAPRVRDRVAWVVLAAVPSSLLLGVTTHITTDLAPVPLLWVIPLALYLLTFVVAFGNWFEGSKRVVDLALPYLTLSVAALLFLRAEIPGASGYALHVGAFFVCSLACHLRLFGSRPHPVRLTEFYLWIAIGGAVGAVFNVLLAPRIFTTVLEYPIALVLSVAIARRDDHRVSSWDIAIPLILAAVLWTSASVHVFSTPFAERVLATWYHHDGRYRGLCRTAALPPICSVALRAPHRGISFRVASDALRSTGRAALTGVMKSWSTHHRRRLAFQRHHCARCGIVAQLGAHAADLPSLSWRIGRAVLNAPVERQHYEIWVRRSPRRINLRLRSRIHNERSSRIDPRVARIAEDASWPSSRRLSPATSVFSARYASALAAPDGTTSLLTASSPRHRSVSSETVRRLAAELSRCRGHCCG